MTKYGDIEISDDVCGVLHKCSVCEKSILVEEVLCGARHPVRPLLRARWVVCWECLTPEKRAAATQHYKLKMQHVTNSKTEEPNGTPLP